MGLTIGNSINNFYDAPEKNAVLTGGNNASVKTQTVSVASHKPKLPVITGSVDFTALGCNTEEKLAQASYMAAAAKAGIASADAQREFARQMIARHSSELSIIAKKDIPLDDDKVAESINNRGVTFQLSPEMKAELKQFRENYIALGGKMRRNETPTIDLREKGIVGGATDSPTRAANSKFPVLLNNTGNPTDTKRILAQFAEDRYRGGNLWGENYAQIAGLSAAQGVKPKITNVTPIGNKVRVEVELTPLDQAKIHENYKIVQSQANKIEKIVEKINNDNPVSQFILGAVNGIKDNLVGTAEMVAHPLETLNAIKEVTVALSNLSSEDIAKIAEQLKDKIKQTVTTEEGINSLPYGAGYAVGAIAAEIILTKGAGAALDGLKGIKAIDKLLTTLDDFKALTKVKAAEMFSDEAATVAKQKFAQRIRELGLSPNSITNIAADPELWARATQVAGNTVSKGYTKFADFSGQVIKELGEVARPHLDKLYRQSLVSLDLSKGKQILSSSGKVIEQAVVREAKEKVFDLVKQNKSVELEKYLSKEIRESYGKEFEKELRKTADSYVDGLYETTRRTVDTHDLLGGHIRDEHIGRSETWLRNRLETDPTLKDVDFASSFPNEATASRALGKFVKQHEVDIETFLKNPNKDRLEVVFDSGEFVGKGVTRGKVGQWEANKVYVMIVRDNSEKGWHILTAYPTLRKEVVK